MENFSPNCLHGFAGQLTGAALRAFLLLLWGQLKGSWSMPQAIVYGLVTRAALLVIFDKVWWKPNAQTAIYQWLGRAADSIQKDPPPQDQVCLFYVTDKQGKSLAIYQDKYEGAPVFITTGLECAPEDLKKLSIQDQDDLATGIQMALLTLGVGGQPRKIPLQSIVLSEPFVFDNTLTEREFVERTYLISRAITSIEKIVHHKLSQLPSYYG